jgi:hypothetical protein
MRRILWITVNMYNDIGLFSGTVSTLCNKHSVKVNGEGVSMF